MWRAVAVACALAAAGPAEAGPRVLFLGITRTAAGTSDLSAPAIEAEVARRLSGIGLEVVRAAPAADQASCDSEACLSQKARELGVEHVVVGSLVRGAAACAATLLLYSAQASPPLSRAEVKCHRDASEDSLAPEFADQAGQLGERLAKQPPPAPSPPAGEAGPVHSTEKLQKSRWPWNRSRRLAAAGLGMALAGSALTSGILFALDGQRVTAMSERDTRDTGYGFLGVSVFIASGLVLSLTLP
ncbi:MAG: hypothetical protein U1A78_17715 [Polyangia bacterium]